LQKTFLVEKLQFTCVFDEVLKLSFCLKTKNLQNENKKSAQMLKIKDLVQLRELQDAWCFLNREFIWVNDCLSGIQLSSL